MQYWNVEKAGAIFSKEDIFLSINIVSISRVFTQIKSIEKSIFLIDSCHLICLFIYLFIFCHVKEKVKMKRKAVEKSCEPDIRNEFSISLVRITKSVNDFLLKFLKQYLRNTFLTASFLKLIDTYKKQSKLHQAPESIMVIKVWLTEYDQQTTEV